MKAGSREEKPEGVVTSKGQLVIPAEFRRRYNIENGTRVRFEDTHNGILVRPITDEYIDNLRGVLAKQGLPADLERDRDRELP